MLDSVVLATAVVDGHPVRYMAISPTLFGWVDETGADLERASAPDMSAAFQWEAADPTLTEIGEVVHSLFKAAEMWEAMGGSFGVTPTDVRVIAESGMDFDLVVGYARDLRIPLVEF